MNFITLGCHIPYEEIYNTDKPTDQIPNNSYFPEEVFNALENSEIVVFLISSNFLHRPNCLIELGMALAHKKDIIFLFVPPITHSDMPSFTSGKQTSGSINEEESLINFTEKVMNTFFAKTKDLNKSINEIKSFLKDSESILQELESSRDNITRDEYEKVKKTAETYKRTCDGLSKELNKLNEKYDKVKKAKDANEVRAIEREYHNESEKYHELINHAKNDLKHFDSIMRSFIYSHLVEKKNDINPFDYQCFGDDITKSVEKAYINTRDGGYYLNEQHPKIAKALNSLNNLNIFLSNEDDQDRSDAEKNNRHDFLTSLEKEHEFPIDITNKDYWNLYFK